MKTNLIIGWFMVIGAIVLAVWFIILLIIDEPLPGIGNVRALIMIPFIFLYGLPWPTGYRPL